MASAGRNLAKLIGANQKVKLTGSGGDSDFNAALDSDASKLAILEREIKARLDSDQANPITNSTLNMGSNDVVTTGKVYFANMFSTEGDLPSASTYHGMFAHVHATGAAYFAHGGNWIKLANNSDLGSGGFDSDQIVSIIKENPTAADSDSGGGGGGGGGGSYSIEMLIVGGGGGGGGWTGGGGGAGGYRTSTQTVSPGEGTLTITVGAGGAGGPYGTSSSRGVNGSASSVTGTPITDFSSAGGGGGGGYTSGSQQSGADGGSGGGSGHRDTNPGSGNVPSTTPVQGYDGGDGSSQSYNMGGGGGAGAVGNDGYNNASGGEGGTGIANTITGSSVTYAGGGSGALQSNRSGTGYNPGGAGGGGNGGAYQGTSGSAGGVNTGGGGGGNRDAGAYAGGSGVVILKVPTSSYTSTVTGSPTVTTSGGNTIIKFTGSGQYAV